MTTLTAGQAAASIAVMALVTFLTRALPFLLFDRREDLKPGGAVLPLYEGASTPLPPLLLPPAMEERLPVGADRGQLLAALREAGALRPGQITVGVPQTETQKMLPT